jgi:hypothetical protein
MESSTRRIASSAFIAICLVPVGAAAQQPANRNDHPRESAIEVPSAGKQDQLSAEGVDRAEGLLTVPTTKPRATACALSWLAERQNKDGSWSFSPPGQTDEPKFANPGTWRSRSGATGLALLPFLGAGQNHKSRGPYRKSIAAGLDYLLAQAGGRRDVVDFRGEGNNMLWHGIATDAICECYGMTGDKSLAGPAQKALDFIVARQDGATGGWSVRPGEEPAMSVTAWQVLALKSGKMAGLQVDATAFDRVRKFLDRVQSDGGAMYGEGKPGKDLAATAGGLLCRIYLGAQRGDPAIQRGADYLIQAGPAKAGSAYTYFGHVFLSVVSGPKWDEWNRKTRRELVGSQTKEGQDAGSWWFPDERHATDGGRLYHTALAAMTLEVPGKLWLYKLESSDSDEQSPQGD